MNPFPALAAGVIVSMFGMAGASLTVVGEPRKWHKVTLACIGPTASETGGYAGEPGNNPFTFFRMNARFTHRVSGKSYTIPGYFAGDGDAANTSATSGNVWHVHFAPDEIGEWTYAISFREGADIAISMDPVAGSPVSGINGLSGAFDILPSDKVGRDLRGKGRLQYVGKHHLRFAETGEFFMKCGIDSPENLLAYEDFDDTPDAGSRAKSWSAHQVDYIEAEAGPFTWIDPAIEGSPVRGTELLGAIHYLSVEGLNGFSFLTFSLDGDDDNVFPHLINSAESFGTSSSDTRWDGAVVHHDRFDVSKLAQWENIFAYGTMKGMHLHFKTQEVENGEKMDGGELGPERKLYYRELVARFSHHLALNWNLGEENINDDEDRIAYAQWFYDNDPYRHPIVLHTRDNQMHQEYDDLYGAASKLTGASLQPADDEEFDTVFPDTLRIVSKSVDEGKPWVVACDEPGFSSTGIRMDNHEDAAANHSDARRNALWGNPMAGGGGVEWYFGGSQNNPDSDIKAESFQSRAAFWPYCAHMLEFWELSGAPFWEMRNDDSLLTVEENGQPVATPDAHCLTNNGSTYVIQLKEGATTDLTLPSGDFEVLWYDPRNGGTLQSGTVTSVSGGATVNLGVAPAFTTEDWIVLVRGVSSNSPPVVSAIALATNYQTAAMISVPKVIFTASDPDGDPISLDSAGPASAFGGAVTVSGNAIVYTPPTGFSGADSFFITLKDSMGATTEGFTSVVVRPGPNSGGAGLNIPILESSGGNIIVRFQGVPGEVYSIQRSADMLTWSTLYTSTTTAVGSLEFTDSSPPTPIGFYRVIAP